MKALSNFWNIFSKSILSPGFYAEILKKNIGFSFKFYFAYFFFYAIILTLILTLTTYWPLQSFINILPAEIQELYPEELVITIEDGQVSTNVEEPYYIPLERVENIMEEFEQRVLGSRTDEINNLLVIDTEAAIEDIYDYSTVVLLTRTHLTYWDHETLEVIPLRNIDQLTIDRQRVNDMTDMAAPFLSIIAPILIVFTLISLAVFLPLFNMLYLALFSLATLLLAMLFSIKLNYKKSYQLGLHLIVMPTTLFLIVNDLLRLPINFVFLFTIIMLLWTAFVLYQIKDKVTASANNTPITE